MVTFVEIISTENIKNASVALEICCVQRQAVKDAFEACKASFRIFKRDTADDAVNFVAEIEQMLGQIAAILACDPRN